jgi:hypothetical protein
VLLMGNGMNRRSPSPDLLLPTLVNMVRGLEREPAGVELMRVLSASRTEVFLAALFPPPYLFWR